MSVSTPSLPHVSLPRVDVHDVTERVQDLAASAAERLEDLPDKAVALAGTVIPALRPAPKRSKRPFVLLVLAAIAATAAVAWYMRSRRESSDVYSSVAGMDSTAGQVSAAS
jgi:hypothetical protein